jgi:GNAT superfamily N-acetyltransferase
MQRLAKKTPSPGILAMNGLEAVGWCAVAPRTQYLRLETSRILKPVDEQPVWSVGCFFITKAWRKQGLSVPLLKAATQFAFSNGATAVEGYPADAIRGSYADVFAWTGITLAFVRAGFTEAARRSPTRPVMRLYLNTQ